MAAAETTLGAVTGELAGRISGHPRLHAALRPLWIGEMVLRREAAAHA